MKICQQFKVGVIVGEAVAYQRFRADGRLVVVVMIRVWYMTRLCEDLQVGFQGCGKMGGRSVAYGVDQGSWPFAL